MDAAVIDRIRGYADDGMSPERIASTLDVPLPDVRRHLVGTMAPEPRPAPERQPATADVGPLVDLPVLVEPSAPAVTRAPTAIQREAWEAYHRHGGQGAAARALGRHQGAIRLSLLGYMRAMGIAGPIPPPDPSLFPTPALPSTPAPANPSDSGTVSFGAEPSESPSIAVPDLSMDGPALVNLTSDEQVPPVLVEAPADPAPASDQQVVVGESGAGYAPDIPPAIPEPASPTPMVPTSAEEHRSNIGPADLRARYVELLLALPSGDSIRDRIERALGIVTVYPDDRDVWAEGYRRALSDILSMLPGLAGTEYPLARVTEKIARLAIEVPQA